MLTYIYISAYIYMLCLVLVLDLLQEPPTEEILGTTRLCMQLPVFWGPGLAVCLKHHMVNPYGFRGTQFLVTHMMTPNKNSIKMGNVIWLTVIDEPRYPIFRQRHIGSCWKDGWKQQNIRKKATWLGDWKWRLFDHWGCFTGKYDINWCENMKWK